MAAYQVLLLNTAIPQIQAAQAGDTYVVPRDIAFSAKALIGYTDYSGVGTNGLAVAGNVGIGTSSPQAKLQVLDQIKISNAAQSQGALVLGDGGSTAFNVGIARWNGGTNTAGAGGLGYFTQGSANSGGHYWYTGDAQAGSTTLRMTLDSSGNLGLGVTPSAWGSSYKTLDISTTASFAGNTGGSAFLANNAYNDGSWRYKTSTASIGAQLFGANPNGTGGFAWYTAPSGTAGDPITGANAFVQVMTVSSDGTFRVKGLGTAGSTDAVQFSGSAPADAMRLDASGQFQLGTTTAAGMLTVANAIASGKLATFKQNNASYNGDIYLNHTSSANDFLISRRGNGEAWFYQSGAEAIAFYTSATERARITSGGNFLVGTDNSSESVGPGLKLINSAVSPAYLCVMDTATAGNSGFIIYNVNATNNGYRAYIQSNGGFSNFQANDVNLSDARLKTDITPVASYWDKIKSLEIVSFKYKDQSDSIPNIGVIAQQVESVAPEFVSNDGFGEAPEGEAPYKTIYTTDMYHAAIKALQEAMSRIETLEAKIAALEQGA